MGVSSIIRVDSRVVGWAGGNIAIDQGNGQNEEKELHLGEKKKKKNRATTKSTRRRKKKKKRKRKNKEKNIKLLNHFISRNLIRFRFRIFQLFNRSNSDNFVFLKGQIDWMNKKYFLKDCYSLLFILFCYKHPFSIKLSLPNKFTSANFQSGIPHAQLARPSTAKQPQPE